MNEALNNHNFSDYFKHYINLVDNNDDVITALEQTHKKTNELIDLITEEQGNYAYAEGKWSIKELLTDADGRKRDYIYSEIGKETGGSDYTIRNISHKYIKFDNGNEGLYNLNSTFIEGTNLLNTNQLPLSSSDEAIKNELILKLSEIRQ